MSICTRFFVYYACLKHVIYVCFRINNFKSWCIRRAGQFKLEMHDKNSLASCTDDNYNTHVITFPRWTYKDRDKSEGQNRWRGEVNQAADSSYTCVHANPKVILLITKDITEKNSSVCRNNLPNTISISWPWKNLWPMECHASNAFYLESLCP